MSDAKVEAGKTLTSLPTTTREGYTFDGWYDGSTKWTTSMTVNKDITLKAHWAEAGEAGKKELTSSMVSLSFESAAYTGKEILPAVTVKDGDKTLTAGTDYTISYENNKNIGLASVTVTGKGNYTGTVNKTFTITAPAKGKVFTVSKCKYKITDEKKYTVSIMGTSKKGKLTIGATVKIGGKNYKITGIAAKAFKNNKNLTKVVIGKNISAIGKQAFYGCKNLKSIAIKTEKLTAKKVGSRAFEKISSEVEISVPKKKKAEYKKILKKKGLPKNTKIK